MGHSLQDNICFLVLIITQAHKYDITLQLQKLVSGIHKNKSATTSTGAANGSYRVYPNLLAHFATNMAHAFNVINAHCFEAAIAQHPQYLGILWTN